MRVTALAALLLAACTMETAPAADVPAVADAPLFPTPDRPVATITSDRWSDEDSRDREGEAERVIAALGIVPGMTVADIGAGSGYYTVRLSPVVGPGGLVLANDIMPDHLERLRRRVADLGLSNVTLILGEPGDALLPPASTDVALMVHMYHEIEQPFGLLWHLHAALRPGARVAIIDADRPTHSHGTPPALLACELEAVGFRQIGFERLPAGNYLAVFEPGQRPEPAAIRACRMQGGARGRQP